MEVSIYELLAAARESAKSDYIKGDSILCEKRFHPDTHYMVEMELLGNDNKLGEKGELHTKVSDRTGVSSIYKSRKTPHKNKKTGHCSKKEHCDIYPLPDRLDSRRKRDIF